MNNIVNVRTVNNRQAKGVIVTAEILLDFRRLLRDGMFGEG